MAALTLRQFATATGSTSVTFGSAPLDGSLLIAIMPNWTTFTAASGWSIYVQQTAANSGYTVLYKYCGAGESTTQTFVTSGNSVCVGVWEITGSDYSSLANNVRSVRAATAVTLTANAYTTPATTASPSADCTIIGMCAAGAPTTTTMAAPTVSSTQSNDGAQVNNTYTSRHFGATFFHEALSSAGTARSYTADFSASPPATSDGVYYILVLGPAYTPVGKLVTTDAVQVLNSQRSNALVTTVAVSVLRSISDLTTQVDTTKITAYAVLDVPSDNELMVDKVTSYAVMREEPTTAASILKGYAVLQGTATVATKVTAYAVMQVNNAASKLTAYAVLARRAPKKRRGNFFIGGD